MKIVKQGKEYEVDSVAYCGAIANVNGTSITHTLMMACMTGLPYKEGDQSCTVFCDSDELWFPSFEEAYRFATEKQKDGMRL